MKKQARKLLRNVAWIVTSAIAGWQSTYYIDDSFPGNMPYSVDVFIRYCLAITGRDDLANPDDMEVLALLLYWAIATLVIGALLLLCHLAIRHYRARTVSGR